LLAGAILLAYSNSFRGPFLFDDIPSIPDNPTLRSLWPPSAVLYPPPDVGRTVNGRPLVNFSLALNYAVSGLEVWSYHALNLVVHILASLTLLGVVRRTLLLPRFAQRYDESASWLALAVALIWGVHPLQTESVSYLVQRAESMVGLWYLLTLYCVIRGETGSRRTLWFVLAVLSCTLGMATKEVMATAPLVVLIYLRVFVFPSWREVFSKRWPLLAGLAASWLLLAALVIPLGGRSGSVGWDLGVSAWDYAATQCRGIVTYLKLSVSPQPLVFDYGSQIDTSPREYLPYAIVILLLLAATAWALLRLSAAGFLGAAFFLILAPSSSFVPIATNTMAEHRMYLPLACVVALVVIGTARLWQRVVRRMDPEKRERGLVRAAPALLVAAVALLFGLQTWLRNLDYQSPLRMWQDTAEKQPGNPRAWTNLAEQLMLAGDTEGALAASGRPIELDPESPEAWFSRGTYRMQAGLYREAIDDFDHALDLDPRLAKAYQNRGAAKRRLERYESAIEDFDRALELAPALINSYRSRALALAALSRMDEARRDAKRFLQLGGPLDGELRRILEGEGDGEEKGSRGVEEADSSRFLHRAERAITLWKPARPG
jgi:tetratricopeptide (TPR) repeat protein